ncbi:MAG: trehalose-phosphatase [bacterium]|nr:trehalose-phosphatase [bacterium]
MTVKPHWREALPALRSLVHRPRFGLISDFDGTLSPFSAFPTDAAIHPAIALSLDTWIGRGLPLALVSGRAAADLYARYPRPGVLYYGNHGMEYWHEGQVVVAAGAQAWEVPLESLLGQLGIPLIPGVMIENKRVTASVHYRATADPAQARLNLYERLSPLAESYGFLLSEGQFIWEIKPPVALNKGTALAAIIDAQRLDGVLFLGDDVTDFTAMARLTALRADSGAALTGLSIGVLHPTSRPELTEYCDMTTHGVDDTAALMDWIIQEQQRDEPNTRLS